MTVYSPATPEQLATVAELRARLADSGCAIRTYPTGTVPADTQLGALVEIALLRSLLPSN